MVYFETCLVLSNKNPFESDLDSDRSDETLGNFEKGRFKQKLKSPLARYLTSNPNFEFVVNEVYFQFEAPRKYLINQGRTLPIRVSIILLILFRPMNIGLTLW